MHVVFVCFSPTGTQELNIYLLQALTASRSCYLSVGGLKERIEGWRVLDARLRRWLKHLRFNFSLWYISQSYLLRCAFWHLGSTGLRSFFFTPPYMKQWLCPICHGTFCIPVQCLFPPGDQVGWGLGCLYPIQL